MIKNIVWDIGNVITKSKVKAYITSLGYNEETNEFLFNRVFAGPEWQRGLDLGKKTLNQVGKELCELYPDKKEEIISVINLDYSRLLPIQKDVIEYIKELGQANYNQYILSNISKEIYDSIKLQDENFEKYFKGITLSYREGALKPASEIDPSANLYMRLLNNYHLNPQETIFLDDSPKNINMANRLGINGIVYTNLEDAKIQVNEIINSKNIKYKEYDDDREER